MKNKLKYFLAFTFFLFIPFHIFAYENEIHHTIFAYILFVIPIVGLIMSILIWYKYGKNEQVIETVEFYLPHDLNSLETALLYKGKATKYDVVSLLIYLANKGYIQIIDKETDSNQEKVILDDKSIKNANKKILELENKIELEKKNNPNSKKIKYYENMLNIYKDLNNPNEYKHIEKTIDKNSFPKENLIIKKVKEYDGNNEYEELFMNSLFWFKNEIKLRDIKYEFYKTINRILTHINSKENRFKVQKESSINKKYYILLIIVFTYLAVTIPPVCKYNIYDLVTVFSLVFLFSIILLTIFENIFLNVTSNSISTKLLYGGVAFIFLFILWRFVIYPILIIDSFYLIAQYIGLVCILGMLVCLHFLPNTTKYGNEVLGKLRGYKNFLLTLGISKDYNEFYDILPFSYVLDMNDEWIKKYKDVNLTAPNWYICSKEFDIKEFDNLYKYLRNVMIEEPPSEN